MIILHADLDSTLIYSDRHDIGEEKIKIDEYSTGVSYITVKTLKEMLSLPKDVMIVPTTTRSEKLYKRINWQGCIFKYALVANGGILLENGVPVEKWKRESEEAVEAVKTELEKAWEILKFDERRKSKMDFVDQMFIVTKVDKGAQLEKELNSGFEGKGIVIRRAKEKLYVMPEKLEKGEAVERFRRFILENENICKENLKILAAGDGEFDISMFHKADFAYANAALRPILGESPNISYLGESGIFSEEILQELKIMI